MTDPLQALLSGGAIPTTSYGPTSRYAETPVRTDSVATIESQGVTGVSYVGIDPGTPETPLLVAGPGQDVPEIPAGRSTLQSLTEDAPELVAEHGLSLYIETGDMRIVFDTGASGRFAANATTMGIDLAAVDALVVSHHHFDHGGGLERFLTLNRSAPVYLRQSDAEDFFFRLPLVGDRYIGLDQDLLRQQADRLTFVSDFTEITAGVFILTEIPDRYPVPKGNKRLFVKTGDCFTRDSFNHELVMVIREADGLVVFTGCSHHGVLNMVSAVTEAFPGEPIKCLFGGFHLVGIPFLNTMAGSRRSVREIGEALLGFPIERVYTGHCTGRKGFEVLKEVMADKLENFPAGSHVIV